MGTQSKRESGQRLGPVWVNPHSNTVVSGPEGASDATLRHYHPSLDAGLKAWGRLDGQTAALADVRRIVGQIVETVGAPIFEVYVQASNQCVVVVLADDLDTAAAWIHTGFIDHPVKLPGDKPAQRTDLRRTDLPTAGTARSKQPKPKEPKFVTCPDGHNPFPSTSTCDDCGWDPKSP